MHSSFTKILNVSRDGHYFQSLTMLREQSTSTWLSVTAKGVNLEKLVNFKDPVNLDENFEPVCPELNSPSPLLTLDHLPAYHLRNQFIYYKPEKALTDVWIWKFSETALLATCFVAPLQLSWSFDLFRYWIVSGMPNILEIRFGKSYRSLGDAFERCKEWIWREGLGFKLGHANIFWFA